MARRVSLHDPDRFLLKRRGFFSYSRRVPKQLKDLDDRWPCVRVALGTQDLAQARAQRDIMEKADSYLWSSLIMGMEKNAAMTTYRHAVAKASALGFTYRHASTLPHVEEPDQVMARIMTVADEPRESITYQAALGTIDTPKVKVSESLRIYMEEIVADELVGKSENQKRNWKKVKQRAVDNFVEVVSDKPVDEITREDAKAVYDLWRKRIAPATGKATHSASSGNRDVGNMRVLLSSYMKHIGVDDYKNPFDGFSFSEKVKRSRPPFSVGWITGKIMHPGALAGLNDQARGILLALIETGCRPSEIINLNADRIFVDSLVPYIDIRPNVDTANPREIKTASSRRQIPLVGIALEVFKKHPKGFPHYADREELFSATATKFLRSNGLFETPEHKIYSFRHAFEDRMKVAGIDTELRMILMGHSNDRPQYGKGGSLEWRRQEMMKIVLPFGGSIV